MKKATCIAIDDEPLALLVITQFCERFGGLELTTFSEPLVGLEEIRRRKPDLVFPDIVDFLHKPFAYERFEKAVEKAIRRIETERDRTPDSIVVKQEYNNVTIPTNDILYIEAMENYTKIFRESGGYILSRTNMKTLQEILPEESFLRIHRSYIVPIDRVEMFSKKKIKLAGQETLLPVGRQFANHIYDLLIARNSGGSRTNL